MTIVQKLAFKQLWLNKKRSLITVIGVVISVAMITGVITLGLSFMNLLQRQVIANEGEWHFSYSGINAAQLEVIEQDPNQRDVLISQDEGYAYFEGSTNPDRPYFLVRNYNATAFETFPIHLKEGRLPTNPNELLMSESVSNQETFTYEIGDTIEMELGQRVPSDDPTRALTQEDTFIDYEGASESLDIQKTVEYTIVGTMETPFFENSWNPGYVFLSYIDEQMITGDQRTNAFVIMNDLNQSSPDYISAFAEKNDIGKIDAHNNLLRYYGIVSSDRTRNMLITLSAIVIVIIVIGSISLIYNAFAISVSERARQLGMLSSVGATKQQKRNIVIFEGILIGAVSIPIGIIGGFAGIGVTFLIFNSLIKQAIDTTETLQVVFSLWTVLIAIVISVSTLLLSTYLPAKKASEITAIEAIRQTQMVKLSNKTIRTPKLVRKFFGIEGELASKNIKRNRSGYRAIVFSLSISVILFLTISYFATSLTKSNQLLEQGVNYDVAVTLEQRGKDPISPELFSKLTVLDEIDQVAAASWISGTSWIEEDKIAEELIGYGQLEDGKYPYNLTIYGLDAETMARYAATNDVDYESMTDTEDPKMIVQQTIQYLTEDGQENIVESDALNAELGDKILPEMYDLETDSNFELPFLKIAALADTSPIGVSNNVPLGVLNVFVSEEVFNTLIADQRVDGEFVERAIYYQSNQAQELENKLEDIQADSGETSFSIYNRQRSKQRGEQIILLGYVFSNAFVILITLICIATIFNTISTSISLRKREFAMLRSMGMTPKSFTKMIQLESIFYGIKALLYGLPISFLMIYAIYRVWQTRFQFQFEMPWIAIMIAVISVFIIIGLAMIYSSKKIKKDTIIDGLKQENI
ncbi:ABC transporter permease [Marinilactibacillus kalidii]|uniref:ABC transporter permease n=1 Tax=Marinilactibacillus kalidii TaxID=2820274 RepID=UPI001ABEDF7F|nr:ABC transporter permease [Marinilactibacillus kalidii]